MKPRNDYRYFKMKQQTTALLLCALIFSTLAHEHWRAKEHSPPQLKHEKSHSRHLTPFHSRENEESCAEICGSETNETTSRNGLKVMINVNINILILVNETAKVALIFGYSEGLVVVLDGNNGAVAVIDLQTGKGVYVGTIHVGTFSGWKASQQSIEEYIKAIVNLRILYNEALGVLGRTEFSTTTSNRFVQRFVYRVLIGLDSKLEIQNSQAVTRLVAMSRVLNLSLKTLGKLLQNATFNLNVGGLQRLGSVLSGVVTILLQIVGILGINIDDLVDKGVDLDLSILLNLLSNGSIFVLVVGLIQAKTNIDVALTQLLSVDNFFKLLAGLSANIDIYVVIYRLVNVLETSSKSVNVSNSIALVEGLLVYVATVIISDTNQNATHQECIDSLYKLNNISSVARNSSMLQDLLNGNLTVQGVNINNVIDVLLEIGTAGSTGRSAINVIISVLIVLQDVLSLVLLVPIMFVIIVIYLMTSAGWVILRVIFPTVRALSGGISAIIAAFLKINISALIHMDFYNFLKSLPIVGDIITVVADELQKNNTDLSTLLNAGVIFHSLVKFLGDLLTCVLSMGTSQNALCKSFNVTSKGINGNGGGQLSGKGGMELGLCVNIEFVRAVQPVVAHCEKNSTSRRRLHNDKHFGYVHRHHAPTHEKKH